MDSEGKLDALRKVRHAKLSPILSFGYSINIFAFLSSDNVIHLHL